MKVFTDSHVCRKSSPGLSRRKSPKMEVLNASPG
eukprot:CAMPEP_0181276068 /NCGR_PEP_ID=MMETSP1097-20121128/10260_1 /TAXON_ID=35684 /ORGANISM="Pseudopedinella elastica, Strain CCMP716" /LENGTH=33 /DNA_ID= /DNA_START= /DNA_END= /DNA_ORIENTATION=